jgi:hypothetical protein
MDSHSGKIYESPKDVPSDGYAIELPITTYVRPGMRVGPNDRCPCMSGKKFKRCCQGRRRAATGIEPGKETET